MSSTVRSSSSSMDPGPRSMGRRTLLRPDYTPRPPTVRRARTEEGVACSQPTDPAAGLVDDAVNPHPGGPSPMPKVATVTSRCRSSGRPGVLATAALAAVVLATPVSAVGPAVTVSPTGPLPAGAQTLTVAGQGFDAQANTGAGIYVVFGPITAAPVVLHGPQHLRGLQVGVSRRGRLGGHRAHDGRWHVQHDPGHRRRASLAPTGTGRLLGGGLRDHHVRSARGAGSKPGHVHRDARSWRSARAGPWSRP